MPATFSTPLAGTPSTGSTGTLTPSYPTPAGGILAGDILTLCASVSSATAPTNPAGWTSRTTGTSGGSSPSFRMSRKIAVGGETGTLSVTTPAQAGFAAIVWSRGVDQTTPDDVASPTPFGSSTSTTAYSIPAVTTTLPGTLIIYMGVANLTTGTYNPPSQPAAFTELLDQGNPNPSSTVGYLIWSGSGLMSNPVDLTRGTGTGARGGAGYVVFRPAPTPFSLTGEVDASTAASGSIGLAAALTGAAAGTSAASGSIVLRAALTGEVDGISAASGAIGARLSLTGTVAATSGATGSLTALLGLSGVVAGNSAASGAIALLASLSGTVAAVSSVSGTPAALLGFTGVVTAVSDVTGQPAALLVLNGTVVAISGTSGDIEALKPPIPVSFRITGHLRGPTVRGHLRVPALSGHLRVEIVEGDTE